MVALLIFAALGVGLVVSYPSGPPALASTCLNLMPGSSSPHMQQSGDGTYSLTVASLPLNTTSDYFTYTAGVTYTGEFKLSITMYNGLGIVQIEFYI